MSNPNRLPFPESVMLTGPANNNSPNVSSTSNPLLNSSLIRPETATRMDSKRFMDMPTLPSLNEVIKPMLIDNPDQLYGNMNSPLSMQQPYSHPKPQQQNPNSPLVQSQQSRNQQKPILPLPSLLNSIPQQPTKQNLYLVNERNQIEFERQNAMHQPPMLHHPSMSSTGVNSPLAPNIHSHMGIGMGSNLHPSLLPPSMNPNISPSISPMNSVEKQRMSQMESRATYQMDQLQQAKRLGEAMQTNLRTVAPDQGTKKRKTETQNYPPTSQQYVDPNMVPLGGDSRSAFSPLKRRDTPPIPSTVVTTTTVAPNSLPSVVTTTTTTSPLPLNNNSPISSHGEGNNSLLSQTEFESLIVDILDVSPTEGDKSKLPDDQNNFAHLLQNNFSGINLSNDSSGELLEIYRNFHKNDNARLTPTLPHEPIKSEPLDSNKDDRKENK